MTVPETQSSYEARTDVGRLARGAANAVCGSQPDIILRIATVLKNASQRAELQVSLSASNNIQ